MVIPSEEKQPQIATSPQIVTSPDGKFKIINHHSYVDRYGCYLVEGAVKYISLEPNLSAEIKTDYYTREGEFIDTDGTTIAFHESGGTRSFYIMYSGPLRREVQCYKLYITAKKEF